ncbi:cyclin-D3-1-like [Rutidosis leptorrhynchoides]|uniref:cyclin-D3-1-like n=1 Tax=Rutidosis leptorrhynchoides TaxID=125765 RepID=UPI003A9A326B
MAISSPSSSSSSILLDTFLYCEEQDQPWTHDHDDDYVVDDYDHNNVITQTTLHDFTHLHIPPLNNQDFFWEDEELVSLFTKEQQQQQQLQRHPSTFSFDQTDPYLLLARKQAVDWILKVKSHFGFTHLTAILSINYLDRFLSSFRFQKGKPWMIQLLAVTCLSLAAKVEETQVPTLLDLQVVDTEYLFEPKNIQKMELLVMSTLKWKMNPVTPISFLDHIVRRLGLKSQFNWDFVKKCEDLILSLVSDSRFLGYQPSVLATVTMLHVIHQVDFFNYVDYQNQLLDLLKTTKEKVNECNELIMEASCSTSINLKKRKFEEDETSSSSSSASSSFHRYQPLIKKNGIVVKQQKFSFGSLSCKAFVDASIPH